MSFSNRLLRQFIHDFKPCRPHHRIYSKFILLLRNIDSSSPQPLSRLPRHPQRTFSTSTAVRASLASHPPGQPTELIYYPTPESLPPPEDPDDPEVELIPPEEAQIEMTERAAEQLRSVAQRQNNPDVGLRIAVESGGCHGYQYKLALAKNRNSDDYHFSHPTIKPSNVLVDAVSMTLLKGSIVDYATELIGSSFRVLENPQAKGSGCGCGVSWELKL